MDTYCPYCDLDTTGKHALWCPDAYPKQPKTLPVEYRVLPIGWVCPKCDRVNAPHINQCPCEACPKDIAFNVEVED